MSGRSPIDANSVIPMPKPPRESAESAAVRRAGEAVASMEGQIIAEWRHGGLT